MATQTRTRVIGVVVVLVVLVAVFLVVRWVRDPSRGPQVLVVGDSVTFLSTDQLKTSFDWTTHLDVEGRIGYRTDQLVSVALTAIGRDEPEIFVVLTGYNDLDQGQSIDSALDKMTDVAASQPCSVWVLLPTKTRYSVGDAESLNQKIEDRAAKHDNIHVTGEWRDAVDATSGTDPDPTLISEDRIHPRPAGATRLAEIEDAAVGEACRGLFG